MCCNSLFLLIWIKWYLKKINMKDLDLASFLENASID